MRASDLVDADVVDPSGRVVGHVNDIRVVQDGPVLGTWGAAFRVEGLIVSRPKIGSFLGYERSSLRGPWLVKKVVTWLHRDARFVPWDDVESVEHRCVRIKRRKDELPEVAPLA